MIPLQVNMTAQALAIIILGAKRSVNELIKEFKKIHVDKKESKEGEGVETMTSTDAMQFPLYAGGTLCCLYGLIKYVGKEVINPLLLAYMGVGFSITIKDLLLSLGLPLCDTLESKKLFHLKIGFMEIDQDITMLDVASLGISGVLVAIYIISKSWLYNNILAILLSINAI